MSHLAELASLALLPVIFSTVVAAQPAAPDTAACKNCGVVASIQMTTHEEQWAPIGLVPGGATSTQATGSEARSAFEFGREGSRGLVVVGAAGGAAYNRQPSSYQRPVWRVTVTLDAGGTRVIPQRYEPAVKEGERVRIMGTRLELID